MHVLKPGGVSQRLYVNAGKHVLAMIVVRLTVTIHVFRVSYSNYLVSR